MCDVLKNYILIIRNMIFFYSYESVQFQENTFS